MTRPLVNSISLWIVTAALAVTPLALGGNRPLVWPIILAVLSFTVVFKSLILSKIGGQPAASMTSFKLELTLLGLFLGFAVLQIMPLGNLSRLDEFGLPMNETLSVAPTESFLALMMWLNVLTVCYLALQFSRNEQRSITFLSILFWLVVAHAALGFVLFHEFEDATLIGPKWAYLGSMTGAFVNRNTFATFLATGAVLGTTLILRDGNNAGTLLKALTGTRSLVFKLIGLLLIMVVLVGTGSRMGLFIGLLGIVLTVALLIPKRMKGASGSSKTQAALVLSLCFLALVMWGFGNLTVERLGSVERDADVRLALYAQTWTMIGERPWTGFGGGTYELAFALFHQPEVSVDRIWQKAHNSYLGLWADYGLIFGTLPWLVLFVILARLARILWQRQMADYAAVAAVVTLVICLVHALVDFSLEIQGFALLFAAVIGTGAARLASVNPGTRRIP